MDKIAPHHSRVPGGEPARQRRRISGQALFFFRADRAKIVRNGVEVILFVSAVKIIAPIVAIVDVQQQHRVLRDVGQGLCKRSKAQGVPLYQNLRALIVLRVSARFRINMERRDLCYCFHGITGYGFIAAREQGGLQE